MYEIIVEGQEEVLSDLVEAQAKIDNVVRYLESQDLNDNEKEALFILCQNHLFDVINSTVKDKDVRKIYNWTHSRSKKAFDALEAKGYVERISKNPLIHKLTDKVITEID